MDIIYNNNSKKQYDNYYRFEFRQPDLAKLQLNKQKCQQLLVTKITDIRETINELKIKSTERAQQSNLNQQILQCTNGRSWEDEKRFNLLQQKQEQENKKKGLTYQKVLYQKLDSINSIECLVNQSQNQKCDPNLIDKFSQQFPIIQSKKELDKIEQLFLQIKKYKRQFIGTSSTILQLILDVLKLRTSREIMQLPKVQMEIYKQTNQEQRSFYIFPCLMEALNNYIYAQTMIRDSIALIDNRTQSTQIFIKLYDDNKSIGICQVDQIKQIGYCFFHIQNRQDFLLTVNNLGIHQVKEQVLIKTIDPASALCESLGYCLADNWVLTLEILFKANRLDDSFLIGELFKKKY